MSGEECEESAPQKGLKSKLRTLIYGALFVIIKNEKKERKNGI